MKIIILFLEWLRKKEVIKIIDLYVALIIADRRTFEQVPDRYKEEVKADLLALGLDENGNPIVL